MSERFFASDNSAPVHPAIMEAIAAANCGHAIAYGDDEWTRTAEADLRRLFGGDARIAFVYNGTGANVLGMQSALSPFHAVVCTDCSHINVDECGAAERFIGTKLLPMPAPDGRLRPEQIESRLHALGVEHHSQPRIVSVTQSTELGTVYPIDHLREIARVCHTNGMMLHMDGARISNAAVALGTDLAGTTREAGVDILSLGGTKNGMMFGEAIVFLRPGLADEFRFIRKQGMQLASKMRYIAAQFSALFGGDLWRRLAIAANDRARELAARLRDVPGVDIVYPVEANAVFVRLPRDAIEPAQREVFFYVWDEAESIVRLMCSFDTTSDDIDRLVAAIVGAGVS